mmetsp:Transcript_88083/g.184085  ORF Transcript_88083/g.184085 Transcript_88083/m.184085 type:complete len:134 (+) Transcript_88083:65-466(+)
MDGGGREGVREGLGNILPGRPAATGSRQELASEQREGKRGGTEKGGGKGKRGMFSKDKGEDGEEGKEEWVGGMRWRNEVKEEAGDDDESVSNMCTEGERGDQLRPMLQPEPQPSRMTSGCSTSVCLAAPSVRA